MKSTLLRTFFEWALITSVLMSVGFFAWYLFKSRDVRAYRSQLTQAQLRLQYNQGLRNSLAAECQAYAKTNADMARFLSSLAPAAPAAPSPAKGAK